MPEARLTRFVVGVAPTWNGRPVTRRDVVGSVLCPAPMSQKILAAVAVGVVSVARSEGWVPWRSPGLRTAPRPVT